MEDGADGGGELGPRRRREPERRPLAVAVEQRDALGKLRQPELVPRRLALELARRLGADDDEELARRGAQQVVDQVEADEARAAGDQDGGARVAGGRRAHRGGQLIRDDVRVGVRVDRRHQLEGERDRELPLLAEVHVEAVERGEEAARELGRDDYEKDRGEEERDGDEHEAEGNCTEVVVLAKV